MTIPQHIVYGVGGSIYIDVAALPTTATVTVKDGSGSTVVSAASATISAISTTLNGAVSAGATSLVLTSATGVTNGTLLRVGGSAEPAEVVRVKSLSGTTATLWRPLLTAHATGAAVKGTRISYTVLAASATTLFFDGRAEWTLDSVLAEVSPVECTKYPLTRDAACSAADIYDEAPEWDKMLSSGDDPEALMDEAHAEVLERVGSKARIHVYTGSLGFKRATVFAALVRLYRRRSGDAAQQLFDRYEAQMKRAIEDLQGFVPRDTDQDGIVEESERISRKTGRIFRG